MGGSCCVSAGISSSSNDDSSDVTCAAGQSYGAFGGDVAIGTPSAGCNVNLFGGRGRGGGDIDVRSGSGPHDGKASVVQGASVLTIDGETILSSGNRIFSRSNHHRSTGGHVSMDISGQTLGTDFALRREKDVASVVACLPLRMAQSTYSSDSRIKHQVSSFPVS